MKLTIAKNDLKAAVLTAAVAANGKSPLPILGHLLLEAREGRLRVCATNLEISVERLVPANVSDIGGCAIPAHLLVDIISQIRDDEVTLHLEGPRLTIKTRTSKIRLNSLIADEFPILNPPPDDASLVIDVGVFRSMLAHTRVCVAPNDEVRESLKGVLLELDGARLSATSTDGRRLAHIEHVNESARAHSIRAIVHVAAQGALARIFGEANGNLSISTDSVSIWFALNGTTLTARCVSEGKFPDYRAITPKSSCRQVWVNRAVISAAMRRALIVAKLGVDNDNKSSPTPLKLEFEPDQLRISSNTPDVGDVEEVVPIRLEGTPLTMAFNGRYLLDAIDGTGAEEVLIRLNDPLSMSVLKPVGNDDLFYLVMPVNVKERAR